MAETKKDNSSKAASKEVAMQLYMSGSSATFIADQIGMTRQTVSRWIDKEGWAERRAAMSITRPELANRILRVLDAEIRRLEGSDEIVSAGSIDKLTKMAAIIERIDRKTGTVETIEVLMAFSKWLNYQATVDPALTPELIKIINLYQNKYITEMMVNNKK